MSSGLAQPERHINLVAIASIATMVVLSTLLWIVFGDRIQHTDNDLDNIIRAGGRAAAAEFLYPESDGGMTYKWAPVSAFFFTPLTWIDQDSRSVVWYGLTAIGLVLALGLIRWGILERTGPLTWRDAAWAAAVLAVLQTPIRRHVSNGQVDIWILILSTVFASGAAHGRPIAAGAAWVTAVSLKLAPLLLIVQLCHRRCRERALRVMFAAAAVAVAMVVLPVIVWGVDLTVANHHGWIERLTTTTPGTWETVRNQSIAGLVTRLTAPSALDIHIVNASPVVQMGLMITMALAIVGLVVATMLRSGDRTSGDAVSFAAAMTAVPILSPVSWDATYLLLMPAAGVWLATLGGARSRAGMGWFCASAVLLNIVISSRVMAFGPRAIAGVLMLVALYIRAGELPPAALPRKTD